MNDEAMKPIDLTRSLVRHSSKRYKVRKDESSVKLIVVHTTDRVWTIEELVQYDVEGKLGEEVNHIAADGLPAITYHDVIMLDGKIYHTLPYREISWHAGGYNNKSIAVALMYKCTNPEDREDQFAPPEIMTKSLQCHCGELCLRFGLSPNRVKGHRELKGTGWFRDKYGSKRLRKSCPGHKVDLDFLRTNIARYVQVKLQLVREYTGEIDGEFGPRSMAALKRYVQNDK